VLHHIFPQQSNRLPVSSGRCAEIQGLDRSYVRIGHPPRFTGRDRASLPRSLCSRPRSSPGYSFVLGTRERGRSAIASSESRGGVDPVLSTPRNARNCARSVLGHVPVFSDTAVCVDCSSGRSRRLAELGPARPLSASAPLMSVTSFRLWRCTDLGNLFRSETRSDRVWTGRRAAAGARRAQASSCTTCAAGRGTPRVERPFGKGTVFPVPS
jgi:hypothetical protein